MFKILRSPAFWRLVCMAAGGGGAIVVSDLWDRPFYVEVPVGGGRKDPGNKFFLNAEKLCGEFLMECNDRRAMEPEAFPLEFAGEGPANSKRRAMGEADFSRRLNFAFYYDQGAAPGDVSQSYAGRAYEALLQKDSSWMSGIYGLRRVTPESMAARLGKDKASVTGVCHLNGAPLDGPENARPIPAWNRFNVTFCNGDGSAVMGRSNSKEILSIASVYAYFNQEQSYDFLISSVDALWKSSHSCQISVSDVYYCQGECLYDRQDSQDEGGQESGSQSRDADGAEPVQDPAGQGADVQEYGSAAGQRKSGETGEGALQEAGADLGGEQTGQEGHLAAESGRMGERTQESAPPASVQASGEAFPGEGEKPQEGVFAAWDLGESVLGMGQGSQEPVSSAQASGESALGMGRGSTEAVSSAWDLGESVQGTGQGSQEPAPWPQGGASQETQAAVHDAQGVAEGTGQMTCESDLSAQDQGESGQGADQPSQDPLSAAKLQSGAADGANQAQAAAGAARTEGESAQTAGEYAADGRDFGGGSARGKEKYCWGHVDLNIFAVILGMDGKKNLFTENAFPAKNEHSGSWSGWDGDAMDCARTIAAQDWYGEYGLTGQNAMFVQNPLSAAEAASYMDLLPADTSSNRREIARQALLSIGCIPYYWGGKPSRAGFEGNGFGMAVSPDEEGRILKGLDCSGWINWVYWTALGSSLPAESTSGLMNCGRAVEKGDLKAGDILIRAGTQPHVYLFLAWAQDGSMYLIHETTGNVNNVTIGIYDLDLPYYRCLINEE